MLSIFDIYKIGVGPSSSHTNGPMLIGYRFAKGLSDNIKNVERIQVDLYGSLSLTGRGHHTDKAVILGLLGNRPDTIKMTSAKSALDDVLTNHKLRVYHKKVISFTPDSDLLFHNTNLPLHENGMTLAAFDSSGQQIAFETFYSTGGGFIATESELSAKETQPEASVSYPFSTAEQMLELAEQNGLSLGSMIIENESSFHSVQEIEDKADKIWKVMSLCMKRGFETEGILDGGLNVVRRAPNLLKRLESNSMATNDPMEVMDWVNLFAFAISEENAAGGQVVTSPTNGAAGVIPAVLMYFHKFIRELDTKQLKDFLAVSGAIGILYKTNASISGAEVGCQGEIGVSSSMAAAGLTSICGGSNEQMCIAAEIAMEHSLGMTCDPIGGLVQVPCIERNAMGAMKAINASRMALKRNSKCLISLDKVIETMYQTGKDMNKKYRETSLGGLATIHLGPPCE
ncbi:L-serine ammonia-lyase [Vibrio sp. S4M6]|uniref:L-serine ammonia-lyase n=1 Tax=Vibrio sinus TaxID=2946865 RepID=UPI00202A75E4|nr:L-serine ammonia-lyase [Vibrio sinus]MCL9780849.1 L-serine ammonia-lyase [Vibrio sinus]